MYFNVFDPLSANRLKKRIKNNLMYLVEYSRWRLEKVNNASDIIIYGVAQFIQQKYIPSIQSIRTSWYGYYMFV